jgi:glycosyltransferase involved in cell wall biosynthesis
MISVHIVTRDFQLEGGLERWTFDLAHMLTNANIHVVVYVLGDEYASLVDISTPFEVVTLATLRAPWEEPLINSNWPHSRLDFERTRLNFICLRNAIGERLSGGRNIVLSNYATSVGHTGGLVSKDLDLDHVVIVAGTDFSRGFRNPRERAVLAEVCRSATLVVGKSEEQIEALRTIVEIRSATVIETGVRVPDRIWSSIGASNRVKIFSDCGFSHKKGSNVLMDAFSGIHRENPASRLEICGRTEQGQEEYWDDKRANLRQIFGDSVQFPGYLSQREVLDRLYGSQIYGSATLGEGSSAARASALCVGIPMVTTACGELARDPNARHIRLVRVGDAAAFRQRLSTLVRESSEERVVIDHRTVEQFRARFKIEREWRSWLGVFSRFATA